MILLKKNQIQTRAKNQLKAHPRPISILRGLYCLMLSSYINLVKTMGIRKSEGGQREKEVKI